MAIWDDLLTERDKEVYQQAGLGRKPSLGIKPALVIIDVTYDFVGDKPEPILQSMKRFPLSCGEEGWQAVYQITSLLPLARQKKIPIIYSSVDKRAMSSIPGVWKAGAALASVPKEVPTSGEIVAEIAPAENDFVIHKIGPSIFFDTHLLSILIPLGVDTLLCCGGTTSGCVRASVSDAAAYGFKVGVIEEGTFDRSQVSHKINLFDMNAKFAIVVSMAEVRDYLNKL